MRRVIAVLGRGAALLGALALIAVVAATFGPLPGYVLDASPAASALPAADRVKAESDIRASLLQAVAGTLLVVGAITAWRQMLISRSQHALSRRVALTDAFTKAVEQLGDAGVAQRIGGVYSLDRVAEDDPAERRRVAEILSAFVRTRPPGEEPAEDTAAALTVLAGRDWPGGADLTRARLAGAHLPGARLADARLTGADLRRAVLTGAVLLRAELSGADLREADLSGADLREARIAGVRLSGAVADARTRWPQGFAPGEHGVVVR